MLGNLGLPEILLIGFIVLMVFGAKRLPEIGSSFGKGIREFKRSISDASDAVTGPDNSAQGNRQIDSRTSAPNTPSSSGEPKRLSQ
ncbi:MAG TPA: twin-arginine translocase TatA/TatE family subunit [Gemmatimonadales bacterium]|nr:twin-arginine translocase TatA/TatE family subunit [Gemmatimonadales bacterium]